MSIFDIRVLSREDASAVSILWKSLLIPIWTEKMIEETINISNTLAYGAFLREASVLVGFIMGTRICEEAEIYGIAVQELYQGKKIGAALLNKFETRCFSQEAAGTIFLEVAQSNTKAQSFYLSQGYNLVTKRAGYYPNKEEAWVFCKKKAGK